MALLNLLHRFKADETGATGIEYALIAALVGILGVTSMGLIGESLSDTFTKISVGLSGPADLPTANSTGP